MRPWKRDIGRLGGHAATRLRWAARALGHSALVATLCLLASLAAVTPAGAVKPITLTGDQDTIDVTALGEAYEGRGDSLQIETAAAAGGATARMAVRAATPGTNPNWLAFALSNPTSKPIELWLTAERYSPIGSGVVWPDLDTRRIAAVSHSAGFAPERVRNDRADIFRLTVEPGQTVSYVAELATDRFTRLSLWKPIAYEQRLRDRQLFNGIMLGITGLLAVFLTAVFAAHHKSIFPTAGLVAWCALALLCVDFGFWHKLFQMKPEDNGQYRAAAEAALAASLVIFLAAFLRVSLWSSFARTLFVVWIVAQLAIVGVAVLDPRLAATVARLSLGLIGVLGLLLIVVLSLRGLDRALALMPTWILYLVWLFGAAVTLTGRMSGEFAISGLVSGLVLILLLIGFTVTQYAFRSTEPVLGSGAGGQQLRLAAMDRAGASFWEWNLRRDELRVDAEMEAALGLGPGELPTKLDDLMGYLHPADRERFQLELAAIREGQGGKLTTGIRVRHADSSYRWLDFEGASVPSSDRRNLRCVGLVRDMTDSKRAQERLLHNAVYDSLTSLPNRELFLDRLGAAMKIAAPGPDGGVRPIALIVIDVDKFRSVNTSFGLVVGDSIILTVSRRIARILGDEGTLARIGGDQFALFLTDLPDPRHVNAFAERLRLSLRSPIRIAGQEVVLTGSLGIALHDGTAAVPRDLLRDAEVAMHRAKRHGSDRAEIFTQSMKTEREERQQLEQDLGRALEAGQVRLLYQPVVALSNNEIIGFEAVVRWQHPTHGVVSAAELVALTDSAALAPRLSSFVLGRAISDLVRWQQELPRPERPLFVAIQLASRQQLAPELAHEIRQHKSRVVLPPGSIKLSVSEQLVMDNPEQATHVLEQLHEAGVELWMDHFGTGYSSIPYLGRFQFDAFKIDKALVEWSSHGQRDAAMVRSIVAVAHELGRQVVGDGVETPEDAAFLRSIGCQLAQGFHFGGAMSDSEVGRLLKLLRKSERSMRRRGMVRSQSKRKGEAGDGDVAAAAAPVAPPPTTGSPQPSRTPPPSGPAAAVAPMRQSTAPPRHESLRPAPAAPPAPAAGGPRPVPPFPVGPSPSERPPLQHQLPSSPAGFAPAPPAPAPVPTESASTARPPFPSAPGASQEAFASVATSGDGRAAVPPPAPSTGDAPTVARAAEPSTPRSTRAAVLSPAVAASLARLAGKADKLEKADNLPQPDAPPGNIKAAE